MSNEYEIKEWHRIKQELISCLEYSADLLDKRHVKVCLTRILGNSVSTVGSGMFVAGIALAPVTAGTSLPILAIIGSITGCMGNVTSLGGVIYERTQERKDLEVVQRNIEAFNFSTESLLSRQASLYWSFVNFISPGIGTFGTVNTCIKFFQFLDYIGDSSITGAYFTNLIVGQGMVARVCGKFALHVSVGLNLIGITVDTVDTAMAIKDIRKLRNKTTKDSEKPSRKLREFITKFKKLDIEEIERSFIQCNGGISLINNGFFYARFKICYFLDDAKMTSYESEIISRHSTHVKEFLIPKSGKDAILKIEILVFGFGCNSPFNVWKVLRREKIQVPYFKILKLTGTAFNPNLKEIKCQNHQW